MKNSNESGFTLIEILVAITVLSLLMVGVYTIIDDSSRTKDQILKEDRIYIQIHSALDRFALDWSQLYTPLFYADKYTSSGPNNFTDFPSGPGAQNTGTTATAKIKFTPTERFPAITESEHLVPLIDMPTRNELIFMSTSGRRIFENSKQSRYNWIRYFVRNSTAEEDEVNQAAPLELVRSTIRTNIYKKDFEWESVPAYVLLRNVKDLRFSFFNSKLKKYVDTLKELNEQKDTPRIIKVKLTIINDSDNEEVIERTYRPIWPFFDHQEARKEKNKKTETKDKTKKENEE